MRTERIETRPDGATIWHADEQADQTIQALTQRATAAERRVLELERAQRGLDATLEHRAERIAELQSEIDSDSDFYEVGLAAKNDTIRRLESQRVWQCWQAMLAFIQRDQACVHWMSCFDIENALREDLGNRIRELEAELAKRPTFAGNDAGNATATADLGGVRGTAGAVGGPIVDPLAPRMYGSMRYMLIGLLMMEGRSPAIDAGIVEFPAAVVFDLARHVRDACARGRELERCIQLNADLAQAMLNAERAAHEQTRAELADARRILGNELKEAQNIILARDLELQRLRDGVRSVLDGMRGSVWFAKLERALLGEGG